MLQLCRHVYHCLPSELEREDARVILAHMAMLDAEGRAEAFRNRERPKRGRRGR